MQRAGVVNALRMSAVESIRGWFTIVLICLHVLPYNVCLHNVLYKHNSAVQQVW